MRELSSDFKNNQSDEVHDVNAVNNDETSKLISDNIDNFYLNFEDEQSDNFYWDDNFDTTLVSNDIEFLDSDTFGEFVNEKKYLYPHSKITVKDFLSSLFALKYKHKFSEKCVDDLLGFFKTTLPQSNNCPLSSDRAFKKIFCCEDSDAKLFFSCSNCNQILEDELDFSHYFSHFLLR